MRKKKESQGYVYDGVVFQEELDRFCRVKGHSLDVDFYRFEVGEKDIREFTELFGVMGL